MEAFYKRGKKYNCTKNGAPYFRKTATINGKRYEFYGDGEKDVLKKIEEAKALAVSGMDFDKRRAKVGTVFRHWLYNIKRIDSNLKASSFTRYETSFRCHIEPYPICDMQVSKVDKSVFQMYLTSLYEEAGLGTATIKMTLRVWKMFAEWAVDQGYFTKNPCTGAVMPGDRMKGKRKIETFNDDERKTIKEYMQQTRYQYDTIIELAFATGMREGELLGLRWEDITDEAINVKRTSAMVTHIDKEGNRDRYRELWDTKTENSERSIPLLPSVRNMLSEHKRKQDKFFKDKGLPKTEFVFTTSTGSLIDNRNFVTSYKRMLERAGVPYRKFHAIRHTFATEAIRRGVNVKDLQMLMGHSDIQTTYIYVHANEDSKKAAMQLLGNLL